MSRFNVRKVAVLGAGVMGAQIAAHLVNVKVPVVLFDLPRQGRRRRTASSPGRSTGLKKLKPAPLGVAEDAGADSSQANYEEHLDAAGASCDLIIEAIAERMDWKLDLYTKIAPYVAPHAIVASNTSGLSITKLSEALARGDQAALLRHPLLQPAALHGAGGADQHAHHRAAKCWTHLEAFVTSSLGKGVVRAKDSPNFIANRVGIAGMLATMKEVRELRPDAMTWWTTSPARSWAAPARAPSAPPTWWAWTPWPT